MPTMPGKVTETEPQNCSRVRPGGLRGCVDKYSGGMLANSLANEGNLLNLYRDAPPAPGRRLDGMAIACFLHILAMHTA